FGAGDKDGGAVCNFGKLPGNFLHVDAQPLSRKLGSITKLPEHLFGAASNDSKFRPFTQTGFEFKKVLNAVLTGEEDPVYILEYIRVQLVNHRENADQRATFYRDVMFGHGTVKVVGFRHVTRNEHMAR